MSKPCFNGILRLIGYQTTPADIRAPYRADLPVATHQGGAPPVASHGYETGAGEAAGTIRSRSGQEILVRRKAGESATAARARVAKKHN